MARNMRLVLSGLAILGTSLASNVWTVNCAPLTVQRSDPIKSPGEPAGHVHAVVGGTAFNRTMNGTDAAEIGRLTTCDKYTDHSNYWAPMLYHARSDGKYQALTFTGMVAYYQNYTCNYNVSGHCPETGRNPGAPPLGLRMIAGDSERRTLNLSDLWEAAILMETGDNGEVYGMPTTLAATLSGHARFPSCWDGINLDSADHQSHVSYPNPAFGGNTQGGMCPESHPVAMINIGAEFGWNLNGVGNPNDLVWANGDTTGYGFHADFIMGWENVTALQESFSNCFTNTNCPWRSFDSPTGLPPDPVVQALQYAAPVENIGLNASISALPGDNPVYRLVAVKGRQPVQGTT